MDFLTMHQRLVKIPQCCRVKAFPWEGCTFKENKKKHDVLAKDRQLENSLFSQYFVPEKRANNFPFLSVPCLFAGLKTPNTKPTIQSKKTHFTAVISTYTLLIISISNEDNFLIATTADQLPKYSKFKAGFPGEDWFHLVHSVWLAVKQD